MRAEQNGTFAGRAIRRLVFVGFAWSVLGCQQIYEMPHREAYAQARSVKTGWAEADIRAKLGAPEREFAAGTPSSTYCVPGRACEDREVRGKLLIYTFGKPIGYYFLDTAGRVEYVYVGGS